MNKKVTVETHLEALDMIDRSGLNVRACFILGHPGETGESIENLIRFISNIPSSGAGLFEYAVAPFILFPLSPIYRAEERRAYDLSGYMYRWKHATMTAEEAVASTQRVFRETRGDALWGYPGEAVNLDLSRQTLKKVKKVRQDMQRRILAGAGDDALKPLWGELRETFRAG
jgi:radical SAM superfamily enzyme YgiQ (UPF0313 family)